MSGSLSGRLAQHCNQSYHSAPALPHARTLCPPDNTLFTRQYSHSLSCLPGIFTYYAIRHGPKSSVNVIHFRITVEGPIPGTWCSGVPRLFAHKRPFLQQACSPRHDSYCYPTSTRGRYCSASARWGAPMVSAPARSAMVRATLRTRWKARAESCRRCAAARISGWAVASRSQ